MFNDELHQITTWTDVEESCNSTMFKDELHLDTTTHSQDILVTPQCLKMNYISMFVIP